MSIFFTHETVAFYETTNYNQKGITYKEGFTVQYSTFPISDEEKAEDDHLLNMVRGMFTLCVLHL